MVSMPSQLGRILMSCHDLCVRFLMYVYFCGALTSVFTAFLCVFASYWYFILPHVLLLFLLDIKPSG